MTQITEAAKAHDELLSLIPDEIDIPPMTDRGVAGQVLDVAWPLCGGNHQDADFWSIFSFAVHLTLRISSPGKDGGQEVEAVGYRWKLHKDSPWGYGSSARNDAYVCEPVYARPQPASTALVERLKERGQAFANQVRLITHLLHGQAYSTTVAELNAFDAALSASQSTSREGER